MDHPLAATLCVMCRGPMPKWRYGSDYCSATCWERHHGAELDHTDNNYYDCEEKEPEDLE